MAEEINLSTFINCNPSMLEEHGVIMPAQDAQRLLRENSQALEEIKSLKYKMQALETQNIYLTNENEILYFMMDQKREAGGMPWYIMGIRKTIAKLLMKLNLWRFRK